MKSIQTKIIVFIFVIIMLCSSVVGGIGMIHLKTVSDQNSAQIMNLSCREEGKKLDQELCTRCQILVLICSSEVTMSGTAMTISIA